jgi:hypothetical protein
MNQSAALATKTDIASNTRATPGRGWFKAGAIGLIVFGAVHLLAVYKGLFRQPTTPQEIAAHEALLALRMDMGPFRPTGWHTTMILNSSYSVLLIFAGALDLLSLNALVAADRLRPLAAVNSLFCGVLFLITAAFQFPPPMLFALACCVFFLVGWFKSVRCPEEPP